MDRQRVWIVVGVVAAVVVGLAALAALWALTRQPTPPTTEKPPPPRTLKVGKDAAFKTVMDALKSVRPGDRISVAGPEHAENLVVDGADERLRNITLEGEEGDEPVRWKPRTRDPSQMIALNNVTGWMMRRFTLDGQDACRTGVVVVTGHCPGSTLEEIRVSGFTKAGIVLANCEGQQERPLTFAQVVLRTAEGSPAEAALRFTINPNMQSVKANQHIVFRNCRLEGSFKELISLADRNTTHHVELKDVTGPRGEPIRVPRN